LDFANQSIVQHIHTLAVIAYVVNVAQLDPLFLASVCILDWNSNALRVNFRDFKSTSARRNLAYFYRVLSAASLASLAIRQVFRYYKIMLREGHVVSFGHEVTVVIAHNNVYVERVDDEASFCLLSTFVGRIKEES